MDWYDVTSNMISFFGDRWGNVHATIPVYFPNEGPAEENIEDAQWLRMSFISTRSDRVAVGGQLRIEAGIAVVNVFTPVNEGDGVAVSLNRDIQTIWEQAHANGLPGNIHLGAPQPVPTGRDPRIKIYRSGVKIPFWFDHTPT